MVYERYITIKGKKYGPYYYESYRDKNGKVISKRLRGYKPKKKDKKEIKKKSRKVIKRVKKIKEVSLRIVFMSLFIGLLSAMVFMDGFSKFSGFVVSEMSHEKVVEKFDKEVDLEVKEAIKFVGKNVGKNKNKRMDFGLADGKNIRLYFDLLNYSEFVEEVVSYGENLSVEEIAEIDLKDVQDKKERLDENEIEEISNEAVVEAEDFDIIVNSSRMGTEVPLTSHPSSNLEYKWGYKVRLDDLNFMAKIDVTAENVSVYDEYTLKVGRNLVSFKDLVDAGYSVRIESPGLENEVENLTDKLIERVGNFSVNATEVNVSIGNVSNVNLTFNSSYVNVLGINESEGVVEESELIEDEQTGYGLDEQTGYGILGNVIKAITGFVVNGLNQTVGQLNHIEIKDLEYESKISIYIERDFNNLDDTGGDSTTPKSDDTKNIDNLTQDKMSIPNRENIANRSVGDNNKNNNGGGVDLRVSEYLMISGKDFEDIDNNGVVSAGDIVYLDPFLIILISKAEHLDINREFISDIYDDVKEKDDNWSEVINDGEYVRVTFEQNLTKVNDITIYARSASDGSSDVEVYRKDGDELVAEIRGVTNESWYKTYLTGLNDNESLDVFDLKVIGSVEFDYVVDPSAPATLWNATGPAGTAYGVDVDSDGNVYVTGKSGNDYYTIKYNSTGGHVWNVSHNIGPTDIARGITVDNSSNVYVTGIGIGGPIADYFTVKYNSTGGHVWNVSYDGGFADEAFGIAVDNSSNVYVTGVSNNNYYTIKYNSTGQKIWNASFSSGSNAYGIAVDNSSNVYITGVSINSNYATVMYDSEGNYQWNATGIAGTAYGIAVDNEGYVYVTGVSNNNYYTIKYNSTGSPVWNVSYDGGPSDEARGIVVDNEGYVYVTGVAGVTSSNYTTFKYDSNGNHEWNITDVSGTAYGIAVDNEGYVYVTGDSGGSYYTIKYNNVSAVNNAPTITYVSNISDVTPIEANLVSVRFNVTVDDADGFSEISSVNANFSRAGESLRTNSSCSAISGQSTSTSQNYSCTIGMWYWDGEGIWNVSVYANDSSGDSGINSSINFTYNQLRAIVISPSLITFNVSMGAKNQTANEPIVINNTGNYNATGNIAIYAINLYGGSDYIDVKNITVDIDTGGTPPAECNGVVMQNATNVTISAVILERGNLSTGLFNETLYYCLTEVPSSIISGVYDTTTGGSWTIAMEIILILVPRLRKRLRKVKNIHILIPFDKSS